jgi:ketosteroid isomerase-like protein
MRGLRRAAFALLAAATLTATRVAATEEADVMTVVKDYNAALNRGDQKAAAADCADELSITDDFAPYSWQGPGAVAGWFADYAAWTRQNVVADDTVALARPWRVVVDGDRAYAVVPATFTYKKRGAKVVEAGSVWTFALRRTAGRWRILSWAWAQH